MTRAAGLLLAVGLAAGCTSAASTPLASSSPSEPPTSTTLLPAPELVPVAVSAQLLDGPGGSARFSSEALTVSKQLPARKGTPPMTGAALVFDPLPVPGRCLTRVSLELAGLEVTTSGELAVYPGAALSLAEGKLPPASSGGPWTLLDTRPRATVHVARGDRTVGLDVTELTRTWVDGGPFPSQGRTVPRSSPLVLVLRPPDGGDGAMALSFQASAADLAVTAAPCARPPTFGPPSPAPVLPADVCRHVAAAIRAQERHDWEAAVHEVDAAWTAGQDQPQKLVGSRLGDWGPVTPRQDAEYVEDTQTLNEVVDDLALSCHLAPAT